MKRIALVLALAGACTLETLAASPALALETYEAQMQATDAASQARIDMLSTLALPHCDERTQRHDRMCHR